MSERIKDLEVVPLLPEDAEAITHWRYAGEHAFYNPSGDRASESVGYMLDAANGFHSVRRGQDLIGFCCFGHDAQVAGGAYEAEALDVGAGMAPALVGHGDGRVFLRAVVDHATRRLGAATLRATIASWNQRALRAAASVGFRPVGEFQSAHGVDFTILLRRPSEP